MRNTFAIALTAALALVAFTATAADKDGVNIGDQAPAFSLQDQNRKQVSLADFAGKIVVLEWVNPGCPFVQRHGKEQTMKNLAEQYKGKDVVWLGVITGDNATTETAKGWADSAKLSYRILLDSSTSVARSYAAKATPHMFVIDKTGKLAYSGAIDNDPDGEKPANARTNYVAKAIDALLGGQTVSTPETKAYGCGVKYK
jgi:peroxiredoxin